MGVHKQLNKMLITIYFNLLKNKNVNSLKTFRGKAWKDSWVVSLSEKHFFKYIILCFRRVKFQIWSSGTSLPDVQVHRINSHILPYVMINTIALNISLNYWFNRMTVNTFSYGYVASDIWQRTIQIVIENLLPPHRLLFPISSKGSFICTIPQAG